MRSGSFRVNQGGTTICRPFGTFMRARGTFCILQGGENLSNIRYNKAEEAYELPFQLWDNLQTVRFYTEDENAIMENIQVIARKLDELDKAKEHISGLLIDDGYYEGGDPLALAKILQMKTVYVDIDDEEIIVCFEVTTSDGYMQGIAHGELYAGIFEITGWVE